MAETTIEWVRGPDGSRGHTVNPIRFRNKETGKVGHFCEKISADCKNCYASRMQKPYLSGLEYVATNRDKGKLFLDEAVLESVLRRRKPTGYFWCDMSDLFGSWVPDEWIDRCFAVMALTPQHRHYALTKRADRMREYFARDFKAGDIQIWANEYRQIHKLPFASDALIRHGKLDPRTVDPNSLIDISDVDAWPLPHVWLGVSAENQETADERIPHLLTTHAAVRFVSVEPLLGPVDISRYVEPHWTALNWVIVGGESGPGARPMRVEWVESIIRQCKAAEVACFVKQLGMFPIWAGAESSPVAHAYKKCADPAEWPEDLRVRQFPEAPRG